MAHSESFLKVVLEAKKHVRETTPQDVKQVVKAEKMLTLQREGLRLVTEGKTSLEELQRVFATKQAPAK